MWIKLTSKYDNNREVLVQTEHIVSIVPEYDGQGSVVYMSVMRGDSPLHYTVLNPFGLLEQYLQAKTAN